jgi:biopolymer transport protein ExbD
LQNGKLDGLRSYLQKMREESGDLQGDITIKGDRRLKWGDVVAVTDACRRAGYKKVGYAAPNDVNNP